MKTSFRCMCFAVLALTAACGAGQTPVDGGTDARADVRSDGAVDTGPGPDGSGDVSNLDAPVSDVPAADTPGGDAPAADVPSADVPSADVPAGDVPSIDVPSADVPVTDVPGVGCATNGECAAGQFCNALACGGRGRCEMRPTTCSRIFMPVCGCDGMTYSNECIARMAGVRVASMGACARTDSGVADVSSDAAPSCTVTGCPSGQMCCASSGACYPSACLSCCMIVMTRCTNNGDCSRSQYCAGTGCGTAGTCEVRPTICPGIFAPVCGCDNVTYGNSCEAAAAGARVQYSGSCTGSADAGDRCAAVLCAPGMTCCPSTGRCYDPRCLSCCM